MYLYFPPLLTTVLQAQALDTDIRLNTLFVYVCEYACHFILNLCNVEWCFNCFCEHCNVF